jgi:hypothetical protein
VEVVFRIYAAKEGGEPLWSETQRVAVGPDGRFDALLGAASEAGLPESLFAGGQARWVGIGVERAEEQTRVLLSSVPYAMKAADAESIGGRALSDLVTQEQLAATASNLAAQAAPQASPDSAAITGAGTAGALALWSSSSALGSSGVTQTGSASTGNLRLGVNTAAPAATLDVNGAAEVRGNLLLPAIATATASKGDASQMVALSASSFNSQSSQAVNQTFAWQAVPISNDTTAPSGTLEFEYGLGAATPATTGLSISPKGLITFASGQKFPGVGTGNGTITGVTTTSPLTGGGTSGAVTIGLDTSALAKDLNGQYAQVNQANTFTQVQTIQAGNAIVNSLSVSNPGGTAILGSGYGAGVEALGEGSGYGVYTTADTGLALYASSAAGAGILGKSTQTAVEGDSNAHTLGQASVYGNSSGNQPGVMGRFNGSSNTFKQNWASLGNVAAGVFADSAVGYGLMSFSDNFEAAEFYNTSSGPTIWVQNYGTGGTGLNEAQTVPVLVAEGRTGQCGIDSAGDVGCTGALKSIVPVDGGTRQVETYAVHSAENWFEDAGSSRLAGGVAVVAIDREFAETISDQAEYHVFLTPRGDCKGLYVTNETPDSFEVHELGGGTSAIEFDYRIMAKRKGHEAERLLDVTKEMQRVSASGGPPPRK